MRVAERQRSGRTDTRRRIAGLAALGLADFTLISLRQLGVIRHLPELPIRAFDSDRVNTSPQAYTLGLPDGPLGATLYSSVLALAGAPPKPAFALLLGVAALAGAAAAVQHLYQMLRVEKKGCTYCLIGAAINFAIAAQAIPPLAQAIRGRYPRRGNTQ